MTEFTSTPATEALFDLGEGVLWDDRAQLVRWVDINKGRVLSGKIVGDTIEILTDVSVGQTAGAVALAEDGGLLVAGARGLITLSPEGEISVGPDVISGREGFRLNDGMVDPFGSYIVGTLSLNGPSTEEVLLRVHPDGSVETLREGIQLSNGLGFSPDGSTVYHVDTFAGTLSSHSYGAGEFDHREPWHVVIDKFPAYPDGITVDAEGNIWVALWSGSAVNCYSPQGELLSQVTVDATQPTCPEFVGENLDRLAITSAQQNLETWSDHSGALFLADTSTRGLPSSRWAGSTTHPYWL